MKAIRTHLLGSLVTGLLIVAPIYLCMLLLLKAMASVDTIVKPVAVLLPDWIPAEDLIALLLVLGVCLAVGMLARTPAGKAAVQKIERSLFDRLPGYSVIRGLTQRVAGAETETLWKPALVEIEEALVPGFIIEELPGDRFTVFVPSVPTPLAGAVYILERRRVHPVDVPFTQAVKVISRWGSGAKDLLAAMERGGPTG